MLNIAAFTGRLVHDPELRHTQSDISVCSFTIACDRSFVKQGQERECDWIDCVIWRTGAEFVSKYFKKGQMIAVDGSIQTRTYTHKNDNKRKAVELIVSNVNFCGGKKDNPIDISADDASPPAATPAPTGDSDFVEIAGEDDLPFSFQKEGR
jgi:single-strand DNA-binding protein